MCHRMDKSRRQMPKPFVLPQLYRYRQCHARSDVARVDETSAAAKQRANQKNYKPRLERALCLPVTPMRAPLSLKRK